MSLFNGVAVVINTLTVINVANVIVVAAIVNVVVVGGGVVVGVVVVVLVSIELDVNSLENWLDCQKERKKYGVTLERRYNI